MRRKGAGFFQQQGMQPWRPQTGVEISQGNAQGFDPRMSRALQKPLIGDETAGAEGQINVPISWISQTFNTASENIVSAQPNRVILIIQNQSSTNPMAVNFDQTASVNGTSPNFVSQGIMLLPGVSLYIDKWCPTGTVHVAPITGQTVPIVVTQGYSAIGNVPYIGS